MLKILAVKLGGSLITEKSRASTVRSEVLKRLASEIAESLEGMSQALLVGHGSGSFGHVTASEHGFDGTSGPADLARGISETQDQAHRLHALVLGALRAVGVPVFSFVPSSAMVLEDAARVQFQLEPLALALESGLVAVTLGDVVLDRKRGASICSTETVLSSLASDLPKDRFRLERVLWMGDTDGVWDGSGEVIAEIDESNIEAVLGSVGRSQGTDVTGGMRHRVEAAWELARRGIRSQILNGLEAGVLRAALHGRESSGTSVVWHGR